MVRDTYNALNKLQNIARRFQSFHYAMQNYFKTISSDLQNTNQEETQQELTFESNNNPNEELMEDEDEDDDDDENYETESEEQTRKKIAELIDRERRANNIVFYGLLTGSYPRLDVITRVVRK